MWVGLAQGGPKVSSSPRMLCFPSLLVTHALPLCQLPKKVAQTKPHGILTLKSEDLSEINPRV